MLDALIRDLVDRGWAIGGGLLEDDVLDALLAEARAAWQQGDLRPAGIGRLEGHVVEPGIRGDHIRWITEEQPSLARERYFALMGELREALNRELFLGLRAFEAQLAVYPPGTFYRPHVDRFADADERVISCLLYLNRAWVPEDGGALRLHVEGGPVDVPPLAGTLVVFRSRDVRHEVLPAHRDRYSLTGWFRRGSLRDVIDGRGAPGV